MLDARWSDLGPGSPLCIGRSESDILLSEVDKVREVIGVRRESEIRGTLSCRVRGALPGFRPQGSNCITQTCGGM